jgi:hypothetical protein
MLLEFPAAAQEVAEERELRDAHLPKLGDTLGSDRSPNRLGQLEGARRDLDPHAPPVRLTADAAHIARALEPVESGGHGPPAQPTGVCQVTRRRWSVSVEPTHAPKVGGVETEDICRRSINDGRGVLEQGNRARDFADELIV